MLSTANVRGPAIAADAETVGARFLASTRRIAASVRFWRQIHTLDPHIAADVGFERYETPVFGRAARPVRGTSWTV
ncbi:MAG: hypothetical protein H7Z10_15345 [Gemmatimonadaceae bacterium]|nr:hypothetical protein [Acetobacteraceae bacterium]